MNNIILTGFCAKAKQITSKKNQQRFDAVEIFVPALSGNIKLFQSSSEVFNQIFEDKAKSLVLEYTITCEPVLRFDGSLQLKVIKVEKKK